MSETTSGPPASSAAERLARLHDELDGEEARAGLPPPGPCPEAQGEAERLLRLTPAQLRAMTAEECGEGAYFLGLLALSLQRLLNHATADLGWSERSLRAVAAPLLDRAGGYSYDERLSRACRLSAAARGWEAQCAARRARADRLAYLAARVSSLEKSLLELQQTRRRSHG